MTTVYSEIQSVSNRLKKRFTQCVETCRKLSMNVYFGWLEENGPLAIWDKNGHENRSFEDFLELAILCKVKLIYANLSLMDLWDLLGTDKVGTVHSQSMISGLNLGLSESGLDPTSEQYIHNLEGKIVFVEFGWMKDNVLHLYREENTPLLKLIEIFDTHIGLQTIDDLELNADEFT